MAARIWLAVLSLCALLHNCKSFGLFDDLLGDTRICEDICGNSYPLHTYEKVCYVENALQTSVGPALVVV